MPLRVEGIGFFPNEFSPRVFWVEIKSADQQLHAFQQRLEAAVRAIRREKAEAKNFAAHVTLARFEKLPRGTVEKIMTHAQTDKLFGEWTEREVELVQSKLMPSGALHAILDKFRIKNE